MRSQVGAPRGGLVVASGYGIKVYVNRGHLVVHDGICRTRTTQRFNRATSGLRRLVVVGEAGFITLEAACWLRDVGAAYVHLDRSGLLLTCSAPRSSNHPALRRAQAFSAMSTVGLEIARGLLHAKVEGQRSLLAELPGGHEAEEPIDRALRDINGAQDLTTLVGAEAQAASAYWGAWAALPIVVGGRDAEQLPDHWHTFGQRHSPLSNSPRQACNPPNAILNYLYALLEAESTLALHTVGLDPTLGIFHTDQRNRHSLALDAMEAVRPTVDAYVLAMLTQRTLSRADFVETRQGACRLTPQLATRLASTTSTWRHHIAPIAESIAQTLSTTTATTVAVAARLTRAHHAAGWTTRAPDHTRRPKPAATPALPNACGDCGTVLPNRRKRYCEDCRHQRWKENASIGRDNAATTLARLRAEQHDPAHGGRAGEIRGRKNAAHQHAVREWKGERPHPDVFRCEILPGLREMQIGELVAATGLSEHYCSLIRLGKKVPHPRHWPVLRQAGGGTG